MSLEICADAGELPARIMEHLPHGWTPGTSRRVSRTYRFVDRAAAANFGDITVPSAEVCSGDHAYQMYADEVPMFGSDSLEELCHAFQADIELFAAVHTRSVAIVHAGVVGWQDRAIVIPGRSFSGKTMLVAALIARGADYYSDEYAVLDRRGYVAPFARPLAIRHRHGRMNCEPEQLGARAGRKPIPIGLILVTKYEHGAVWHPAALTPGQGVLALLDNAPAARHQPAFLLKTFRKAVSGAAVVEGVRGEAGEFADRLLDTVTQY